MLNFIKFPKMAKNCLSIKKLRSDNRFVLYKNGRKCLPSSRSQIFTLTTSNMSDETVSAFPNYLNHRLGRYYYRHCHHHDSCVAHYCHHRYYDPGHAHYSRR